MTKADEIEIGFAAARADFPRCVSIGDGSGVSGMGAIAIGAGAQAHGNKALAIGFDARAIGDGAFALGDGMVAEGDGAIAVKPETPLLSEPVVDDLRRIISAAVVTMGNFR